MKDEAREPEMHDEGEARAEQEMHVDVAGEAASEDRVAVLCGMTYGDVIRAYIVLHGKRFSVELLRVDAHDEIKTVGPDETVTVRMHRVDLIDEMNYTRSYGDELRTIRPIKTRDGGQRKGWQTCYGPAKRGGKPDKHCFKGRPGRNCIK